MLFVYFSMAVAIPIVIGAGIGAGIALVAGGITATIIAVKFKNKIKAAAEAIWDAIQLPIEKIKAKFTEWKDLVVAAFSLVLIYLRKMANRSHSYRSEVPKCLPFLRDVVVAATREKFGVKVEGFLSHDAINKAAGEELHNLLDQPEFKESKSFLENSLEEDAKDKKIKELEAKLAQLETKLK